MFINWDTNVLGTTYRLGFSQLTGRHARSIEVTSGGTRVREYYLAYTNDAGTTQYLLSSFQEDGLTDSDTLPPKTFTYGSLQNGSHLVQFASSPSTLTLPQPYKLNRSNLDVDGQQWFALADLNGDGYPDLIDASCVDAGSALCTHTQAAWYVYWGTGVTTPPGASQAGFEPTAVPFYGIQTPIRSHPPGQPQNIRFIDMNGDRLPDVLDTTQSPAVVYINMGSYFQPVQWKAQSIPLDQAGSVLQDLDGDGCPDLLTFPTGGYLTQGGYTYPEPYWQHNELCDPRPQAAFGTARRWFEQYTYTQPNSGQFIDINGDGIEDWLFNGHVYLGTGTSVAAETATTFGSDISWIISKSPWITSTAPRLAIPANDGTGTYAALVDVTGDGLPDWVVSTEWDTTANGATVGSCYQMEMTAYDAYQFCLTNIKSNCVKPDFCSCAQDTSSESQTWKVYVNTGHGFNRQPITWGASKGFSSALGWVSGDQDLRPPAGYTCFPSLQSVSYEDVKLMDMTGDGLIDGVHQHDGDWTHLDVYENEAAPEQKLLVHMTNGIGGVEDITYLPETSASPTVVGSYADTGYAYPFSVGLPQRPSEVDPMTNDWVVTAYNPTTPTAYNNYTWLSLTGGNLGVRQMAVVRVQDSDQLAMTTSASGPVGRVQITDYGYGHPFYDAARREFRGYQKVETFTYDDIDWSGIYKVHRFQVGNDHPYYGDPDGLTFGPYGGEYQDNPSLAGDQVELQEGPNRQDLQVQKWSHWVAYWLGGLPTSQVSWLRTTVWQALVVQSLTGDLSSSPAFWTAKSYAYDTAQLGASSPPKVGNLTDEIDYGQIPPSVFG